MMSDAEREAAKEIEMPLRVPPEEIYPKVKSGEALLVCAYRDDEECKRINLEGSISFSEFHSRLAQYSTEQDIIFF